MAKERCAVCGNIPLVQIHNPQEYMLCLDSFMRMVNAGDLTIVYQTCPLDEVIKDGKFYQQKLFHQFKCPACGCKFSVRIIKGANK